MSYISGVMTSRGASGFIILAVRVCLKMEPITRALNMGMPSLYFTKPPLPTMPIIDEMAQRSFLYEANSAGTIGAEATPSNFLF